MPVVEHLILVQQKILPSLLTALLRIVKEILRTSHLSVPVWLSCKSLFHFSMYLVYCWGKLFLRVYSTQVREAAGNLISSVVKYTFPVADQKAQVRQVIDDVSSELYFAFQDDTMDDVEKGTTITGVVEEIVPLRSLLTKVKTETSRDRKLDIWMEIIVNSWSQAVLFPYIIGNLLLLRPIEEWCDLESLKLSAESGERDIELERLESLSKINADTILLQRVKNGLADFIQPVQSVVRDCLFEHLIDAKSDVPSTELNFHSEDQLETINTNRESLLKATIRCDELKGITQSIRSLLESSLPGFEEGCVKTTTDSSDENLADQLSHTESFKSLRKHVINTIFHTECVPFLENCLVDSPSSGESEGKVLHQCVNITARLQRVVHNWITPDKAVGEFLSNIRSL
ncbi:integrase [Perkinsela sp. CCAP 1560/4]|nr:integrase [Perkinsela sp. CCAP 1560/4]|eukprot:KNH08490.1 integrase [Perkinsela sp. CCAP 1560/4]